MAAPPYPVAPPLFSGEEPFGLFSVASIVEDVTGPRLAGIEYPYRCDPSTHDYPAPCPPEDEPPKVLPANGQDLITSYPFAVYAFETCPLVGYDEPDLEALAANSLARGEQHAVERAVWLGRGDHVGLAQRPDTVVLAPAAVSPSDALALAEWWLGTQDGLGTLHVNPLAATPFRADGKIWRDGGVYRSTMGHAISFGGGYPLTGPGGAAAPAGGAWMFVTRGVTVYRSEVTVRSGLRGMSNEHDSRAERVYVVDIPCAVAAVPVQLLSDGVTVPEPEEPEEPEQPEETP